MKIGIRLIGIVFFALALSFFLPKATFASSFTLSGKVMDINGSVISGAGVDVIGGSSYSATTNSSGEYSLFVQDGTYEIQVTPPGGSNYSPVVYKSKIISSNTIVDFILVDSQQVTMSGYAYDALGNPLSNASIVMGNGPTVVTDGTGSYSFPPVAPGTYTFYIQAFNVDQGINAPQNYTMEFRNYALTQDTVQDFHIPFKKISIHIQNSENQPVSNVGITIPNAGGGSFPMDGISAVYPLTTTYQSPVATDTSGNVTLWVLPNTSYNIIATPPENSPYLSTQVSVPSVTNDTNITITFQQPVTLSGHVYDALGNPLQNVEILMNGDNGPRVSTDASGNYSFPPVSPGTYPFYIRSFDGNSGVNAPQNYMMEFRNYALTQDTVQDFHIPFKKIDVHVQNFANELIGGIGITMPNAGGGSFPMDGISAVYPLMSAYQSPVMTDASGNVTLWVLPNTSYNILATPPEGNIYFSTQASVFSVTGDRSLTITLNQQQVTMSGHVYDALGNPLRNVEILMNGDNGPKVLTDDSGSYSFPPSAPGTYPFYIRAFNVGQGVNAPQNYLMEFRDYALTQDTVQDFHIPFKKIDLHVQNSANEPISGIGITVPNAGGGSFPMDGINAVYPLMTAYQSPVVTDASGDATLWVLPNTIYSITATPPEGSIYSVFNFSTDRIISDQSKIISLQFVHGQPVTNANLSPNPNQQNEYPNPTTVTLSAAAASGFTIANTYYTLDGGTQQTYSTPFSVSGGGSHTLTFWSIDNMGVPEASNVQIFTIKSNNSPAFDVIGNKTVDEGQLLQFTVSASDSDGDNLSYSAINLPQGATFNASTHTFSWIPNYGQAGNYNNVEFTVMDDGSPMALDTELISITVGHVNRPPVFGNLSGPQEVLSGSPLTFSVSATDPDGDVVFLSSANLPVGAVFDGSTGIFSWTPSAQQEGIYIVTFSAVDNGTPSASSSLDIVITVGHNPTPVEQADSLVNDVITADISNNIENSYLANLQKVAIFIEQGKIQPAINQLTAFVQKVEQDYSQGIITLSQRDDFIAKAQHLIGVLSGN